MNATNIIAAGAPHTMTAREHSLRATADALHPGIVDLLESGAKILEEYSGKKVSDDAGSRVVGFCV